MYEISVVIPVRDEEKNVCELASRIITTLERIHKTYEIVFVTDINRDNTVDVLEALYKENPNIKTIKLTNGFGHHVAVMAGLDYCSGEYIVVMDGDLQDLPEDIPLLYNKIIEGYDVVYTVKEKKNTGYIRNLYSKLFNSIMGMLSDVKFDSNSSMFRIISRKALEEIVKFREQGLSITYMFSFINLPTTYITVRSGVRLYGETKYSFFRLLNFAITSLISFSVKPLRMISNFGLLVSAISFLYLIVILLQKLFFGIPVLGWTTIISLIMLFSGIQLLSLGIIGEYIGKIYIQTKDRPLYIIEKKIGHFQGDEMPRECHTIIHQFHS